MASRLPEIHGGQIFLGNNGLVGVRCKGCDFVLTARTLTELQAACWDHDRFRHLPSDEDSAHTDAMDPQETP